MITGRIDSYRKMTKVLKSDPIQIGSVTIGKTDLKQTYSSYFWAPKVGKLTSFEKKQQNYKQLRAKFLIVFRSVRRYTKYHRESQYLICFLNSKEAYHQSKYLNQNKQEIISVMGEYLENFTLKVQPMLTKIETLLKFLEESTKSLKTKKFQEILHELYTIEKLMQSYCYRLNVLLRNSDIMISSSSYDVQGGGNLEHALIVQDYSKSMELSG